MENENSVTHTPYGEAVVDTPGPDHLTRDDIEHICWALGTIADTLQAIMTAAAAQGAPASQGGMKPRR